MAQSGNPGGELHYVSDIPTEGGLRSDGVGLQMTETEYKLGFSHLGLTALLSICNSHLIISPIAKTHTYKTHTHSFDRDGRHTAMKHPIRMSLGQGALYGFSVESLLKLTIRVSSKFWVNFSSANTQTPRWDFFMKLGLILIKKKLSV